jgi:hypothetical protein
MLVHPLAGFLPVRDPPGSEGRSSTFRISLAASVSNACERECHKWAARQGLFVAGGSTLEDDIEAFWRRPVHLE